MTTATADQDEPLDVLNAAGHCTGVQLFKSEVHRRGLWHATVHIWIVDNERGLLCQKRAAEKSINANLWDFSAAGHVSAGDSLGWSAQRELFEETALWLPVHKLSYLGLHLNQTIYREDFKDFEFNHLFGYCGAIDSESLIPQKEEVSELHFMRSAELQNQWDNHPQNWVPHDGNYYSRLLRFVRQTEKSY